MCDDDLTMNEFAEHWNEPIYSYSRADAMEDGVLIDVSEIAKEAGFRFPVAVTYRLWHEVIVPDELSKQQGQDEKGRLWDVLMVLRTYAKRTSGTEVLFPVIFVMKGRQKTVTLKSVCGPGDDLKPVITVMLRDED